MTTRRRQPPSACPSVRTRLTGFVVSGVLASLGGFLWSMGAETAAPGAFPALRSLAILSAAIIGGLGSVGGALLGTTYVYAIPYFGTSINRYAGLLATGIGLLFLLLFFPGGLARIANRGRDWTARWVTGLDPRPDVVPVSAAVPALGGRMRERVRRYLDGQPMRPVVAMFGLNADRRAGQRDVQLAGPDDPGRLRRGRRDVRDDHGHR